MIDNIYKTIKVISNNEMRGNVTPAEFNIALYNAMLERYEEYFYELNRLLNRSNRGLTNSDFADVPNVLREKVKHFLKTDTITTTTGSYTLPTDLRYIDGVFLNTVEVETANNSRVFYLAKNHSDITPTTECPIYMKKGNTLELTPDTIRDDLKVCYLRNPLPPKWTYSVVNGVELYNPSAADFQDVDMHSSEQEALIRRTLLKLGINLKEPELTNYMTGEEAVKFQQENAT